MIRPKAVLFDKDGTLTDFRATWDDWMAGAVPALAAEAKADPAGVADAIGFDLSAGRLRPDAAFVTQPDRVTRKSIAQATGWDENAIAAWLTARLATVRQVPVGDPVAVLSGLRNRGLGTGVLTNATRREAETHLDHMGLARLLDTLVACDDGHGAKPDPRGALAAARAMGVAPKDVLLVGDGETDRQAAAGAGMPFVGVLTGTAEASAFPGAVAVLPDISALADLLEDWAAAL
ncbi:HAD family hydrolase [Jannaschia aquimarina]|uniref:phosphoglycolate phosphatase n=1 Tax=Jannaschia aquimarina TaxID=935700 RepID=A0A0D1CMM0_9RHOB|nr:HAD family hydrolase [Jannaschia aquimarina]KIT16047.1 Phosphoglycolate phosphatase [Jannaschia aquimarina]SNT01018.1 phosphoglycolate phosphatase [Jannaschia aquimarina]